MALAPKFAVGEAVEVVSSGNRGTVVAVSDSGDYYTVKFRDHSAAFTRITLKRAESQFENREAVNNYPITGSHNLISQGIDALEQLYGTLDENPELSISEIEIYENMPIKAVLSDDYGHQDWIWAPAGWVKVGP